MTAPYTRATLDHIRKGASPADLGWDEERYRRICREHGIEPGRACGQAAPIPIPDDAPPAPSTSLLRTKRRNSEEPRSVYVSVAVTKSLKRKIAKRSNELGWSVAGYLGNAIEALDRAGELASHAESES